jgi:hypothetical protein
VDFAHFNSPSSLTASFEWHLSIQWRLFLMHNINADLIVERKLVCVFKRCDATLTVSA